MNRVSVLLVILYQFFVVIIIHSHDEKINSLVKGGKVKVRVDTMQTQGTMLNGGTEQNWIIWKLQNYLFPPTSLHFNHNNSITWDRDGNRNKVIGTFSQSHKLAGFKNPEQCKSLISGQEELNIIGSATKALALLKALITNSNHNSLVRRKILAIVKPLNRDSKFIFHSLFSGETTKENFKL